VEAVAVDIRPCRPEDEPELLRLAEEAMRPQVEASGASFEAGRTLRTVEGDTVFVADCGGHIGGYVALRDEGEVLVVEQLAVSEMDQGQHVGHRLLDWAEGWGVNQGKRALRILVETDNRRARDFYSRRGYLPAGERALERELAHE
jgi:predicted N-acetyltransferase YhbS